MSDSPSSAYSLLPWVRRGLASRVSVTPATNYAAVGISLALNGSPVSAPAVRLLGPGDIKSMDARAVIRSDPRDGAANFEPNYLAAVEFGQPDFPWMFTPSAPTANGRLQPWICLAVVPDAAGATITVRPDGTAILQLDSPLNPAAELPNLADIDMWAHAQVLGENLSAADLSAALDGTSSGHLSRLISPRKLEPAARYLACVVPTYHAGVNAGLGLPVLDNDLAPAWDASTTASLTLPVYYSFRFQTGPGGDFASLAQQIRPLDPHKPPLAGARLMDLSAPGFGFTPPPPPDLTIGLEGSLSPALYESPSWPGAQTAFLNSLRATLTPPPAPDPVVTPPVYGRRHAGANLPADALPPNWLRDLNLDPKTRAAASAGAQVVQRDQEALLASAWDQLGEIRKANQLLRQAQLARQVSLSLITRHLNAVADDGAYLQITAPVHARVQVSLSPGSPATMRGQITDSRLPAGAVSSAFRKLTRSRGPVGRQLRPAGGPSAMLARFDLIQASGSLAPLTAAPEMFRPQGMVAIENAGFPPPNAAPTRARVSDFRTAILALGTQLNLKAAPGPPVPPLGGPATLAAPRQQLQLKLNPERTIRARAAARIPLSSTGDPLRPLTATPVFPQPMYSALAELGSEWLFPGISQMLVNTVALLETNPPFVEAFLIGLNDEMSRELLWRDVPVDLRGTYFKNFWGTGKNGAVQNDITDIASFNPAGGLGTHTADPAGGKLVLLVRADLFRRYPNALISAIPARWTDDNVTRTLSDSGRTYPIFRGQIGSDVYFFGFDQPDKVHALGLTLPPPDSAGWYFLLEEHPTEPRFGLEPVPGTSSALPTWNDFAWTQVTPDHNHLSATHSPPQTPAGETIAWGSGAAEMAYILMRRPVRIAMHALALIGKD